jgi:hypothetical protein
MKRAIMNSLYGTALAVFLLSLTGVLSRASATTISEAGILVRGAEAMIVNTIVFGNAAGDTGGGITVQTSASAKIINSTVSANTAGDLGAGLLCENSSSTTLVNSIVWGNVGPGDNEVAGTISFYMEEGELLDYADGKSRIEEGDTMTMRVVYAIDQPRDLIFDLVQQSNGAVVMSDRKSLDPAVDTIVFVVDTSALPAENFFTYYFNVVPVGGNVEDSLDSCVHGFAVDIPEADNQVLSLNGPETLVTGETVEYEIEYIAREDSEISVNLISLPFWHYICGAETISVPQGTHTINVSFEVIENIIYDDNYEVDVKLMPIGGTWQDAYDDGKLNVNVIGSGTSVSVAKVTDSTLFADYYGSTGSQGFVGIYDVGGTAGQGGACGYYAYAETPNTSGGLAIDVSSLGYGTYEARLIDNGGYFTLAVSNPFTINGKVSITNISQTSISADYDGATGTHGWVGVYEEGGFPGYPDAQNYFSYTSTASESGSVNVDISSLQNGDYELRLIDEGGYWCIAVSEAFTIE